MSGLFLLHPSFCAVSLCPPHSSVLALPCHPGFHFAGVLAVIAGLPQVTLLLLDALGMAPAAAWNVL